MALGRWFSIQSSRRGGLLGWLRRRLCLQDGFTDGRCEGCFVVSEVGLCFGDGSAFNPRDEEGCSVGLEGGWCLQDGFTDGRCEGCLVGSEIRLRLGNGFKNCPFDEEGCLVGLKLIRRLGNGFKSCPFDEQGCLARFGGGKRFSTHGFASCGAQSKHELRSQASCTTNALTPFFCLRVARKSTTVFVTAYRSITMCVTSGESCSTYLLVARNTYIRMDAV